MPPRKKFTIAAPDNTTALIDMAASFGHGAMTIKRMGWTVAALQYAQAWMEYRLSNSSKDYWAVRKEAVDLAYLAGRLAATIAKSQGTVVITEQILKLVRKEIEKADAGILGGDCPF